MSVEYKGQSDKNANMLTLQSECERLRDEVKLREDRNDSDRKAYEGSIQNRDSDNRDLMTQFHQESEELRTKVITVSHELEELRNTNVNARASLDRQCILIAQDKNDLASLRTTNERHFTQHTQDESEMASLRSQLLHVQGASMYPHTDRAELVSVKAQLSTRTLEVEQVEQLLRESNADRDKLRPCLKIRPTPKPTEWNA